MTVVSRLELENAQKDVATLASVVNGAADLPNPGKATGTVTSRLGTIIKTLSRVAADGTATVEALLTPVVYENTAGMDADKTALAQGVYKIKAGQTCYNRQTTQIYILTSVTVNGVTTRSWEQVSDLAQAASAGFSELITKTSPVGRVSVDDFFFLKDYDRFLDKGCLKTKFIKWPGKSTVGEGLAKVFASGATAWPAGPWGQEGVDFSVPNELLTTLLSGNQHPAWVSPRIAIKPETTKVVSGYNVQGYIDINSLVNEVVTVEKCIVDGGYNYLTIIVQNNQSTVNVDRCLLRNFQAQAITFNKGTVSNCLIENSKADGLKGDFFNGGVIYNCLVHNCGLVDPLTHADAIQCQNSNGLSIFGCTFYMPGSGSTYSEGTNGSTQMLRVVTENNQQSHKNMIVAGNLFIGGGYSIAVRSRFANGEASTVDNVIIANNLLGNSTYNLFGHISAEHGKSTGSTGVIRNLLMHGNQDQTGAPMSYGGINQNGLWHYDKTNASAQFMELAKRWGYLDWNGDLMPGVVSRTEVNQAAGTIP